MSWKPLDQTLVYHSSDGGTEFGRGRINWDPKGAAQGLGLQAIARDLGIELNLTVLTDATAAIGICRRRGLGKVRHLATADLWMQDRIRKGDFKLVKVAGSENPADMLTKHVDKPLLLKHTGTLGLSYESGRAASAPAIP